MAHVKSGGAARQHAQRPGKRLGVKVYGGQSIKTGEVIVRQRGTHILAGRNVGLGKDHTLFALKDGLVQYGHTRKRGFNDIVKKRGLSRAQSPARPKSTIKF